MFKKKQLPQEGELLFEKNNSKDKKNFYKFMILPLFIILSGFPNGYVRGFNDSFAILILFFIPAYGIFMLYNYGAFFHKTFFFNDKLVFKMTWFNNKNEITFELPYKYVKLFLLKEGSVVELTIEDNVNLIDLFGSLPNWELKSEEYTKSIFNLKLDKKYIGNQTEIVHLLNKLVNEAKMKQKINQVSNKINKT